jgi:hypothetical protein
MKNNKVFLLLPDGIGLRNFAYTDFYEKGRQMGFDLTFWNNTSFDVSSLGFKEIRIVNQKCIRLPIFSRKRVCRLISMKTSADLAIGYMTATVFLLRPGHWSNG